MREYSENLYGTVLGAGIYLLGSVHILVGSEPLEHLKFHVFLSSCNIYGIRCKKPSHLEV
jgi:hypothetical protein